MTAKAAELQREVRENAEDYQNYLKDLYGWEKEIKFKDEMLKNAPKIPVQEQVLYKLISHSYYYLYAYILDLRGIKFFISAGISHPK